MKEKLLDILKPQGECISEEKLISYARGTLAGDEARRVEEHLTECEFCSDALDGIMKSGDFRHYHSKISSTKRSLHRKLRSTEDKAMFPFTRALAIAATVLLLVVSAWFVQYVMNNESQKIFSDQFKPYPADSSVPPPLQPAVSEAGPQVKSSETIIAPEKKSSIAVNKKIESQNNVADERSEKQTSNDVAPAEEQVTVDQSQSAGSNQQKATDDNYVTVPQASRSSVSNFTADSKTGEAQNKIANDSISFSKKEEEEKLISDHLNLAIDFYQNKKYVEAISEFQLVLNEDPSNSTANFYSGVSALALSNVDEALKYFKKTDNKSNQYYEATLWYEALTYIKKDDKKEAKKLLVKIIDMNRKYKSQAEETLKQL